MTAIIFGSHGQDGYYLTVLLRSLGIPVVGVSRQEADVCGDVADREFVSQLISSYSPQYIFHFAANSTTQHDSLFENHATISMGTLNILEAARLHAPDCRIFLSGSAVQFQNIGLPIDEATPFAANNPYAVARIQSVYAGRYYREHFSMKIYVGYFFNHDSPLRTSRHVNKKIALAVKSIASGKSNSLELGNVDVRKEFNYAGDMIRAVFMMVNQDDVFEAVLGSGIAHSIKDYVIGCFSFLGLDWQNFVRISTNFIPDYQILISNPARICSLGWERRMDFKGLIRVMMEDRHDFCL